MDADYDTLLFHMAVKWFSKGNMLPRVYKLRKEVKLSLKVQRNQNLLHLFTGDGSQLTLA